jgi:hypothetical protein
MAYSPHGSRIVYSSLPETLTEDDLPRLFTVTSEEWAWARGVARRGPSMVALLAHLKMFQHVGRFLSLADLPSAVISHVAKRRDFARCQADPLGGADGSGIRSANAVSPSSSYSSVLGLGVQ